MATSQTSIDDFLAQRRIAVAGVSREGGPMPANAIYRKLRDAGYTVYALNPKAEEVEGDRCYPGLDALPEVVDGLVIATPPEAAPGLVDDCARLGVGRVWMHRSFGTGSVSDEAAERGRRHGLSVIAGACPMMFVPPVDVAHTCIKWMVRLTGGMPKG